MFMTFILGLAAGFGSPYAEPHIKKALENVLLADSPMEPRELRMFSFSICLLGAAILSIFFGNSAALALALGAAFGVFGPRVIETIQAKRAPDYSEEAESVLDDVKEKLDDVKDNLSGDDTKS
jgi:hypothetical protein